MKNVIIHKDKNLSSKFKVLPTDLYYNILSVLEGYIRVELNCFISVPINKRVIDKC